MRSHVDDLVAGTLVFSRDCPEYEIKLPAGRGLVILANHLKSKGFGSRADSNARRLKQARRVREIYEARKQEGATLIAVVGDFFRKGVWGGKNGTLWEIYPEMTAPIHAASDHAAIWADLNL
jgi:endonuclease/exonuclease/phosphatase family metal-dependent hydrolase